MSPRGNRLAVITNGGGPGVMAADRAAELGIALATLSQPTLDALQSALPANWSRGNPVDLIGDADARRYRAALAACLADDGVDGIVAILSPQAMTDARAAADAVVDAAKNSSKPVIACWMGEASVAEARRSLRAAGLPVFRLPEMAVEAFACLADFNRNQRTLLEAPPPLAHSEPPDLEKARAIVATALREGREVLGATESKELLAAFRIPVMRSTDCSTAAEAMAAADRAGYPVVMKIRSPDITHKSDVGGVHLGITDKASVRGAFEAMVAEVARRKPEARIAGVSIEPMLNRPYARELMVGIARDPIFGPAIMFGAGGIAVEVLKDRVVGLPPLNAALVEDMIHGTKVSRMLERFRNLPPVDRAALDAVLLRVSEMATQIPEIQELDVNPLVADGEGALALDARVVVRAVPPGTPRYGHLAILPYPVELEAEVRMRDGKNVFLRPIRPEDAKLEEAFIAALSPEAMRLRFLSALRSLTPAMLARFTQIDYDREMALIALVGSPGDEREVGVCRFATLPDAKTCEYAIVLADEWHGKGLGAIMMRRLIAVARASALETMVGEVLASNEPMLRLCTKLGFAISAAPGDLAMRRVTLDLRG